MRVRVYYNLHTHKWSVRCHDRAMPKLYGKVVAHADKVWLNNAHTVVSKAGRERVLREGRKNVHAFVDGVWMGGEGVVWRYDLPFVTLQGAEDILEHCVCQWRAITYNPFKYEHFVWRAGEASTEGATLNHVYMDDSRGVYAV